MYKTALAAEPSQQQHLIYPLQNTDLPKAAFTFLFIDSQCCPTGVAQVELGKINRGEMVPVPSSP